MKFLCCAFLVLLCATGLAGCSHGGTTQTYQKDEAACVSTDFRAMPSQGIISVDPGAQYTAYGPDAPDAQANALKEAGLIEFRDPIGEPTAYITALGRKYFSFRDDGDLGSPVRLCFGRLHSSYTLQKERQVVANDAASANVYDTPAPTRTAEHVVLSEVQTVSDVAPFANSASIQSAFRQIRGTLATAGKVQTWATDCDGSVSPASTFCGDDSSTLQQVFSGGDGRP